MEDINTFFEKKLSKSLIYEQIYPYTYKSQPKYLLEDIKDLMELVTWLSDYYQDFYCYEFFHKDLVRYLEGNESLDMDRVFQYQNNIHNMPVSKNWQVIFKRKFNWLILTDEEEIYMRNEAFNSFLCASPAITYRFKTRRQALQRNINDPKLLAVCRNVLALMTEKERTFFVNYVVTRDGGAKLDKFRYLMDSSSLAEGIPTPSPISPTPTPISPPTISPPIQRTEEQEKKYQKRKRRKENEKRRKEKQTKKELDELDELISEVEPNYKPKRSGGLAKLVAFGSGTN